jgi:hypothetical protein
LLSRSDAAPARFPGADSAENFVDFFMAAFEAADGLGAALRETGDLTMGGSFLANPPDCGSRTTRSPALGRGRQAAGSGPAAHEQHQCFLFSGSPAKNLSRDLTVLLV